MKKSYSWVEDPEIYVLGSLPTIGPGDDAGVIILDAYSQWVFGFGQPFLPAERLRPPAGAFTIGQNPDDFSFAFVHALPGGAPAGPRTSGTNFAFSGFSPAQVSRVSLADIPEVERSLRKTFQVISPLPLRASSVAETVKPGSPDVAVDTALEPESLVITAIIDDAINIFNRRFSVDGQSRIENAWIMDADVEDNGHVLIGRELTQAQISAALSSGRSEVALMQDHGLIGRPGAAQRPSALRRSMSHGTFVADLAAGHEPQTPEQARQALHSRMITVQLPALAVADTSGATLISSLILAISFVYARAEELSRAYGVAIPVALNISFGFSGGPKNGQHYVERVLRDAATRYRDAVADLLLDGAGPVALAQTLPIGNDHLRQTHAVGEKGTLTVGLRLQPDDQTASFVEIWLPYETKSASITLTPPGAAGRTVDLTQGLGTDKLIAHLLQIDGASQTGPVARLSVDTPLVDGEDRDPWFRVLLALAPTRVRSGTRTAAPSGRWQIEVTTDNAAPIHAWIGRDQDISDLTVNGRQAYFDDAGYDATRFDSFGDLAVSDPQPPQSPIRRDGTVSGFATQAAGDTEGIKKAVTGFVGDGGRLAFYAAAGFGDGSASQAADLAARAERSRVRRGLLGTGTLTGSTRAMNGTSVASPIATRAIVEGWQSNRPLSKKSRPAVTQDELRNRDGVREARLKRGGELV